MTRLRKSDFLLLVRAAKGGFVFRSDARRKNWSVSEPLFKGLMANRRTARHPPSGGVRIFSAATTAA
jgi:hypothetical protein